MKTRSEVIIRRTYSRPLNEEETRFESWEDICNRVIQHQKWLWERAKSSSLQQIGRTEGDGTTNIQKRKNSYSVLNKHELEELEAFRQLMVDKKVSVSGRTLWLGGTEISQTREASQFNCSGTIVETVYDVVDVLWLLMQGCFDPNTLIQTPTGLKKIGDIQVGDEVLAYDEKNEKLVTETVLNKQESLKTEKLRLEFDDGYVVECTEDHEFLTERGWVQAKDLLESDEIIHY